MVPDDGSMDSPSGSPVADQVSVAPDAESVAEEASGAMAAPETSSWALGLATETVSVTVQVKVAELASPSRRWP